MTLQVWTNGCFDLLHAGHVQFLQQAARLGELTVFLNDDDSVRALKGDHRPIVPVAQRKEMLEALRCVERVHVFKGLTPLSVWQTSPHTPHIYVKDSECDVLHSEESAWLLKRGVAVAVLPRRTDVSTTLLEHRIREKQGSVSR